MEGAVKTDAREYFVEHGIEDALTLCAQKLA